GHVVADVVGGVNVQEFGPVFERATHIAGGARGRVIVKFAVQGQSETRHGDSRRSGEIVSYRSLGRQRVFKDLTQGGSLHADRREDFPLNQGFPICAAGNFHHRGGDGVALVGIQVIARRHLRRVLEYRV